MWENGIKLVVLVLVQLAMANSDLQLLMRDGLCISEVWCGDRYCYA